MAQRGRQVERAKVADGHTGGARQPPPRPLGRPSAPRATPELGRLAIQTPPARRPAPAGDPASLIELARRQDSRSSLPRLTALARELNVSLGAVEVYRGTAARRACDALDARALTAGNVILFGEALPAWSTIAHELAHVIQQRAHRAPPLVLAPGTLAVADCGSPAEREAGAFAAGALPPAELSRAGLAVYRDGKPTGLEKTKKEMDELPDEEQRFRKFLELQGNELAIDVRNPQVFCREKEGDEAKGKYARSSARKFQFRHYQEKIPKALDGELPKIFALGGRWRLSKVGPKEDDARAYAVTGSGPYQPVIYEVTSDERKEPTPQENAQTKKEYRDALDQIPITKRWKWKTKPVDETAVTSEELSKIRGELVKKLVFEYSKPNRNIDELYKDVIQKALFNPGLQGKIFQEWVRENRPGVVEKAGEVYFKNKKLNRRADLVVNVRGKGAVLGEAKGLSGDPDQERKEQMKDYLFIITKQVEGFYSLDGERIDPVTYKFVRYYFPNKEVAARWTPALLSVFGKKNYGRVFDTDPKLSQPQLKRLIALNPKFEVTIDHADDPANLTHRVPEPPVKIPGFKIRFYEVTLKSPGVNEISAGRVSMDIDAKGAPIATEAPSIKPIKASPSPAGVDAQAVPELIGVEPEDQIENGFDKPKVSGLDRFLKKVQVDVRVTDDGLAATIDVDPESASIARIAFEKATLEAAYTTKGFSAAGEVKLSYAPDPKKLSGSVKASYKKGAWTFAGEADVNGLIDGLDAFKVKILHDGQTGTTTIGTPKVHVRRAFKGVTLTGDIVQLSYNVSDGGFSADNVQLAADLGPFGSAKASAKIDDNRITRATFAYDSPEMAFPRGKNRVLSGKLGGEVTYENEQLSGKITGTAHLHVPALDKIAKGLSELGLTVDAKINPDGSYEGTIASDKAIKLGKHFEVPAITATLAPDGAISSEFTVSIVDLSILKKGEIHCTLGPEHGFRVVDVTGSGSFGDPEKGKYWGHVALSYKEADRAFVVAGDLSYKIKEGMVATGTITYNSATHKVDTDLAISRITLLQLHKQNKLLDLQKKIVFFSFYSIVGAYLDLGFGLVFDLDFDLGLEPKFQLKDLDLVTFTFKEIDGQVKLDGQMRAALTATPYIGLGIYAISPSVLRAGGGLEFPIVAEAKLNPNAIIHVQYTPDGDVKGAARAALTLTFGITGAVRPYAEFAVLDDLYKASWHGDELTSFTILPERELFTHVIDFGDKLEKDENPKLPTTAKPPPAPRSDTRVVPQEKGQAKPTAVDTTKKDPPKEQKGEEPKDEQGFSLTNLIAGLKKGESYQKVAALLDGIAGVWGALQKAWQWVVKFFRNWYDRIKQFLDDLAEFFKRLGRDGLLAAIKWVLLKVLGPDLYEIIVPILDALQAAEEKFFKLLDTPLPDGFTGFITWTIDVVRGIIGIGFDTIIDLGKAVVEVARRAAAAAVRFLNGLIKRGNIGVKRTPRYVGSETLGLAHYFLSADHYKIHIGSIDIDSDHSDDSIRWPSPSAAVAYGLWYALDAIPGVHPTNTRVDPDSGDPYNDYWN